VKANGQLNDDHFIRASNRDGLEAEIRICKMNGSMMLQMSSKVQSESVLYMPRRKQKSSGPFIFAGPDGGARKYY
jgi:hypothetical protein